jgi:hypothetical protein
MLKTYTLPGLAPVDKAPEFFEVEGVRKSTREPFVERFEYFDTVPATVMITFSSLVQYTEDGKRVVNAQAVAQYFARALLPESAVRFLELIDDDDRVVTLDVVAQIALDLAEVQSGRPSSPPSD